jgi:hypothetical protein
MKFSECPLGGRCDQAPFGAAMGHFAVIQPISCAAALGPIQSLSLTIATPTMVGHFAVFAMAIDVLSGSYDDPRQARTAMSGD